MTEEYKNNILAYLVGKLPQEEKKDIPQFNNWEVNNSGIRSQIANKLNIASNFVIIYNNLSSNSNDLILIYGRYIEDNNNNPFIAIMSKDGVILQVITTFSSGSKLFNIVGMQIDDDNSIYAVSSEMADNGKTVRILFLNNIFLSNSEKGTFYIKIKKSYICPLDFWMGTVNPSKYRITKGDTDTYFLIGYPQTQSSSTSTTIVKFKINAGSENEWNSYTIENSGLDRILFSTSVNKTNDNIYFRIYGFDWLNDKPQYSEYLLSPDGNLILEKSIKFEFELSYSGCQVMYYSENNKFLVVQDLTNKRSLLYNLKNNELIQIDTLNWRAYNEEIIRGGFYLQEINNTLFVTKFLVNNETIPATNIYLGIIKNNKVYYESETQKRNDSMLSIREDTIRTSTYILNNYNLFDIFIESNYNNDVENTYLNKTHLIYNNNNNYNGVPYTNINSMVPNYGILYNNSNIPVFARNLYNKTITGRTTQSTVEVPNTYLNDVVISKQNLLSETNSILISNNQTITKNIYETLNINFINTLQIRNDNDDANPILNPIGASRLNNSISNLADYENAKMSKYRINYSDNTNRIINNIWAPIGNFYRTIINIYVNKEINSIDFISDDENTIYCSISPILEINKIYKIKQDVYIDEKIQPSDVYYNNDEVFYNNEKVYY